MVPLALATNFDHFWHTGGPGHTSRRNCVRCAKRLVRGSVASTTKKYAVLLTFFKHPMLTEVKKKLLAAVPHVSWWKEKKKKTGLGSVTFQLVVVSVKL